MQANEGGNITWLRNVLKLMRQQDCNIWYLGLGKTRSMAFEQSMLRHPLPS